MRRTWYSGVPALVERKYILKPSTVTAVGPPPRAPSPRTLTTNGQLFFVTAMPEALVMLPADRPLATAVAEKTLPVNVH
jgi:hypothetical protein